MRRYIWDELLTYHKVIRTVKELSTSEKHPRKDKRHPIFECSPGHEIIDEEIFISDNNKIIIQQFYFNPRGAIHVLRHQKNLGNPLELYEYIRLPINIIPE